MALVIVHPREFTTGTWFRLMLERSSKTQKSIAARLANRYKAVWQWKLSDIINDRNRFPAADYQALAEELELASSEYLWIARSADLFPSDEEMLQAVQSIRPLMDACPYPAYVVHYRLTIIAANALCARLYDLGPSAFGPDLPGCLPDGQYRLYPHLQGHMDLLQLLFDPSGPFRSKVDPEEWRELMAQQLAYVLSYWSPMQVFGEPDWIRAQLLACDHYPDFRAMWRDATIERATRRISPTLATTMGPLHDKVIMRLGQDLRVLLDLHPLDIDPRFELVLQVPLTSSTASAFSALAL